MKKVLVGLLIIGFLIFSLISWAIGINNTIVRLKGEAGMAWANVESSYQRRNDLIGNLVKVVQGAADSERTILTEVIEARAKATSTTINAGDLTPENMAQFQKAQQSLSGSLSRLLVSVERYPDIKSNQNFLNLQSQLEGTENRINVARNRFNSAAGEYNIYIETIPNNIVASFRNFKAMSLYKADAGSEKAPDIEFDFSKKK